MDIVLRECSVKLHRLTEEELCLFYNMNCSNEVKKNSKYKTKVSRIRKTNVVHNKNDMKSRNIRKLIGLDFRAFQKYKTERQMFLSKHTNIAENFQNSLGIVDPNKPEVQREELSELGIQMHRKRKIKTGGKEEHNLKSYSSKNILQFKRNSRKQVRRRIIEIDISSSTEDDDSVPQSDINSSILLYTSERDISGEECSVKYGASEEGSSQSRNQSKCNINSSDTTRSMLNVSYTTDTVLRNLHDADLSKEEIQKFKSYLYDAVLKPVPQKNSKNSLQNQRKRVKLLCDGKNTMGKTVGDMPNVMKVSAKEENIPIVYSKKCRKFKNKATDHNYGKRNISKNVAKVVLDKRCDMDENNISGNMKHKINKDEKKSNGDRKKYINKSCKKSTQPSNDCKKLQNESKKEKKKYAKRCTKENVKSISSKKLKTSSSPCVVNKICNKNYTQYRNEPWGECKAKEYKGQPKFEFFQSIGDLSEDVSILYESSSKGISKHEQFRTYYSPASDNVVANYSTEYSRNTEQLEYYSSASDNVVGNHSTEYGESTEQLEYYSPASDNVVGNYSTEYGCNTEQLEMKPFQVYSANKCKTRSFETINSVSNALYSKEKCMYKLHAENKQYFYGTNYDCQRNHAKFSKFNEVRVIAYDAIINTVILTSINEVSMPKGKSNESDISKYKAINLNGSEDTLGYAESKENNNVYKCEEAQNENFYTSTTNSLEFTNSNIIKTDDMGKSNPNLHQTQSIATEINEENSTIKSATDLLEAVSILAILDIGKNPHLLLRSCIQLTTNTLNELLSKERIENKGKDSKIKEKSLYLHHYLQTLHMVERLISLYGSFEKVSDFLLSKYKI